MEMKLRFKSAAFAAAIVGAASIASAAPIVGTLNIGGSVTVSAATINWRPPAVTQAETGFGTFSTQLPGTGYFAGIVGGNPPFFTGEQRDITRDPAQAGAPPLPALALVGVPIFIDNYLSNFSAPGYDGLTFDLTLILQSTAPICTGAETVNQTCRPDAGSPFTLTRLQDGTAVAFEVRGFFEDSNVADSRSPEYKGRYSTQIGLTVGEILTQVGGGGTIDASFSGNFEAIPEPGTVGLALTGLALIIVGAVRKRSC
jgi:hypothetical protein